MFKKRDRKYIIIPRGKEEKWRCEIWVDAKRAERIPSGKFMTDLEGVSSVEVYMPMDKEMARHTFILKVSLDPLCSNAMRELKRSLDALLK